MTGVLCLVDFPVEEQSWPVLLGIWFPDLTSARFEADQYYEGVAALVDACLRDRGYTMKDQGETAAERYNVARNDPLVDIVGAHPFVRGQSV